MNKQEYDRIRYIKNREKILESSKKHCKENKEKIKLRQREYQRKNKDKVSVYGKKYRLSEKYKEKMIQNKEKIADYQKTYRGINKEKNKIYIDHKISIDSFDLSNEVEYYRCFNYSNIQPLNKSLNRAQASIIIKNKEMVTNGT